jgi:hypothetical protein
MPDYALNLVFAAAGVDAVADIVSGVAGAIGGLGDALISGNAQFEQYGVQYTTLIKNSADFKEANAGVQDSLQRNALAADQAKQHMQDLADFGARTPFELPGVVEADTVLQGFGLTSKRAAEEFGFSGQQMLTIAGDVASGTGAEFKEMALLLGKFSSGATGEAISRMQELGITSRRELAELGLSFTKAGELTSDLPEAMSVVLQLMQDKYGGLMDAQSQTFNGMLSNLEDWKGQTLRALGEPIFDAVKPQLQSLLAFLGSDSTKQAIKSFAEGVVSGVEAVAQVAQIIQDYGVPALAGLIAATTTYALVAMPGAIAAMVTALPAITAATTAFAAQAVAVAAVAIPLTAVAVAVAGVTIAYQELGRRTADATHQLLESRQWWNDSTQAIEGYGKASDYARQQLSPLADTVQTQRRLLEQEIETLGKHATAYETFGVASGHTADSLRREMDVINQHRVALTESSQALAKQTHTLENLHAYDAIEEIRALRGAEDELAKGTQLTDKELKEIEKTIDRVFKQGPAALQATAQTTNTFLSQQEQAVAAHERKLADLSAQFADAKTKKARQAIQEKIDAENKGFQEQQTAAAIAYGQQEAAQRAHLGQELIDYVNAQALKNSAFREKADELTDAIAAEFGVTESAATTSFGRMLNTIDSFASGTATDAGLVAQHLGVMTDRAATTQRAMDALAKKYTVELQEDLDAGRINADEYRAALAKIPARVYTEIVTHHIETHSTRGDNVGASQGNHAAGYRASGGPVEAGMPYIVGEEGPELMIPGVSGAIVSNDALADALGGIAAQAGGSPAESLGAAMAGLSAQASGGGSGGGKGKSTGGGGGGGGGGSGGGAADTASSLKGELEAAKQAVELVRAIAELGELAQRPVFPVPPEWIGGLSKEAANIAQIVRATAIPTTEQAVKEFGFYTDVLDKALGVVTSVADLRATFKQSAVEGEGKYPISYDWVWGLSKEAANIAQILRATAIPTSEVVAADMGAFADGIGKTVGIVKNIADLRQTFQAVAVEGEGKFPISDVWIWGLSKEAAIIAQIVQATLVPTTEAAADGLGTYGDAVSRSVGVIKDIADLRKTMAEAKDTPIDAALITRIADEAERVDQIVSARLVPTTREQADSLSAWADTVGSSVDIVSAVFGLSATMFDGYQSPSDAQLGLLVSDARRLTDRVMDAAAVLDKDGLEAGKVYAEAIGATFSGLKDGLIFLEGIRNDDFALDPAKLAQFEAGAAATLEVTGRLGEKAAAIPPGNIDAFARATSALSGQADALLKLASVPLGDLVSAAAGYGASGAQLPPSGAGGLHLHINNPPAQLDVPALIRQIKDAVLQDAGLRRTYGL